jgi:hypothetical protein
LNQHGFCPLPPQDKNGGSQSFLGERWEHPFVCDYKYFRIKVNKMIFKETAGYFLQSVDQMLTKK